MKMDRQFGSREALQTLALAVGLLMTAVVATTGLARAENVSGDNDAFCADPVESCGRLVSSRCFQKLGAGALPAGDACNEQLTSYRGCLEAVAQVCGRNSPALPTVERSQSGGSAQVCQRGLSACLSAIESDFDACRSGADASCRAECREERSFARQRCQENHQSCGDTGVFVEVSFVEPICVDSDSGGQDASTPAFTPGAAGIGSICRSGMFFCYMAQAGYVGSPCWCPGNGLGGVPPFNGVVSLN